MLVAPARRCRLMARFRSVAITCGPLPVRIWDKSSPNVTSRTQCRRTSMHQWPRSQVASWSGAGLVDGQVGDGVHGFGAPFAAVPFADLAGHLDGLGGVREQDPGRNGDDFQGAFLDPSVSAVVLGMSNGEIGPG